MTLMLIFFILHQLRLEMSFPTFIFLCPLPRRREWLSAHLPMQEDVGDAGFIAGLGRSSGGGHGNPLQ